MTLQELTQLLNAKVRHLEKQRADCVSIGDVEGVVRIDGAIESTRLTLAKLES